MNRGNYLFQSLRRLTIEVDRKAGGGNIQYNRLQKEAYRSIYNPDYSSIMDYSFPLKACTLVLMPSFPLISLLWQQ